MDIIKKPQTIAIILVVIALAIWNLAGNTPSQEQPAKQSLGRTSEPEQQTAEPQQLTASNEHPNETETPQQPAQKQQVEKANKPTAYAGEDFSIDEFERTFLEGTGTAYDGSDVTYKWLTSEEYFLQKKGIDYDRELSQFKGVKIFKPNSARTKFLAPETDDIRFIELYLVVTDRLGQWAADKITITVHGVELENVAFYNVDMPDINLRECTEEYANEHLLTFVNEITELHCNNRKISNLTGLEYFANLKKLSLINNHIQDISPLASLPQLTTLNLGKNKIYDLRPLAALTYLSQLNLHQNDISDVTPLTELNLLVSLDLADNKVEKLQYFGEEFHLKILNLSGNPISNLSPLGLINGLEELYIRNVKTKYLFSMFRHRRQMKLHILDVSDNDFDCRLIDRLEKVKHLKLTRINACQE